MTFADPWYLIILLFIPIMGWWYRRYGYQKEGVIKISFLSDQKLLQAMVMDKFFGENSSKYSNNFIPIGKR